MSKRLLLKWIFVGWLLAAPSIEVAASATGGGLDLHEYQGKVVVLDFWASWCVPCRRSFPWLNSMHQKYVDDGLVIIGINLDQEPGEAARFLQEFPALFKIHYDQAAVLAKKYDVQGMPSSVVIGRDGQTKAEHIGFKVKRQGEYEAAIVAALQQGIVE